MPGPDQIWLVGADVENAYAGLEKKGKGKKGKVAAKAAEGSSQPEDKKLMHSLDMLGAFATLKVWPLPTPALLQISMYTMASCMAQLVLVCGEKDDCQLLGIPQH